MDDSEHLKLCVMNLNHEELGRDVRKQHIIVWYRSRLFKFIAVTSMKRP